MSRHCVEHADCDEADTKADEEGAERPPHWLAKEDIYPNDCPSCAGTGMLDSGDVEIGVRPCDVCRGTG